MCSKGANVVAPAYSRWLKTKEIMNQTTEPCGQGPTPSLQQPLYSYTSRW